MAGQPPEPSFQPSGQDRDRDRDAGLTQGRPAWQQPGYGQPEPGYQAGPGYSQPAGPGQQAYAAPSYSQPPDRGYAAQDRGYSAPDQGYAAAEQPGYGAQEQTAYAAPGQASGQPGQEYEGYQGYQPPGYSQPGQGQEQGQGAGASQWQGIAGMKPAAAKPRGEKGFVGSLLDFSFSSFVTPKIIKILYILLTIWTAFVAIFFLIIGFRTGGVWGGLFTLIIVDPIFILLTLGIWRVVLEAFMVVFRIYEETKKIAENSPNRD